MERSTLLANLFDDKTVAILRCLLIKKDIFYLRDLSRESKVSLATTYRIVQRLKKLGIVKKVTNNKFTYYEVDKASPAFDQAYSLVIGEKPDPIESLKQKLQKFTKNFQIHSTKGKNKKIFIISEDIKNVLLRTILAEVESELDIKLKYVLITPEQFKQMKDIGLV